VVVGINGQAIIVDSGVVAVGFPAFGVDHVNAANNVSGIAMERGRYVEV